MKRYWTKKNGQPQTETQTLYGSVAGCPACLDSAGCLQNFFFCAGFRRGHQIVEYGILITAMAAALFFISTYARRGVQALIKGQADQIASQTESQPSVYRDTQATISATNEIQSDRRVVRSTGDERLYNFESVSYGTGTAEADSITH